MDTDEKIKKLLGEESLIVLSTYGAGGVYSGLVAFAATPDMENIIFATDRSTRKYRNLVENPRVALLVDNRARAGDFCNIEALTITGRAGEVNGTEREPLSEIYLGKNPHLEEFLKKKSCALIRIRIENHVLVSNFQCTPDREI
jgi:nitroimidazol reductase NimA-like FMN-containing flavoprotein (pyridoxamine 5'-phosphate oxidase superfamily)